MTYSEICTLALKLHSEHDLRQGGQKFRISPTAFQQKIVTPLTPSIDIRVSIKDVPAMAAYSIMLRYTGRVEITIADEISGCWQKFCYLKELCHLYLDAQHDYVLDAKAICTTAKNARDVPAELALNASDSLKRPLNSEQAAYLLAIELSVPWRIQEMLFRNQLFAENGDETLYTIAEAAKTPQAILELFKEEYGPFSAQQYVHWR